jgi:hypothetical protein
MEIQDFTIQLNPVVDKLMECHLRFLQLVEMLSRK